MIGTVIGMLLLAGAGYLVDGVLRTRVEDQVASELAANAAGLSGEVDVQIGGAFFVPQLVLGEMEDVHLAVPGVEMDGLAASDVQIAAQGVSINEPRVAESLTLTATLPTETIQAALASSVDLPDGVTIDIVDGHLVAQASLLGVPIEVGIEPTATGGVLGIELTSFSLGGFEVSAADVPGGILDGLLASEVPLEQLPADLDLTSIEVLATGVRVELTGADVNLDQLG